MELDIFNEASLRCGNLQRTACFVNAQLQSFISILPQTGKSAAAREVYHGAILLHLRNFVGVQVARADGKPPVVGLEVEDDIVARKYRVFILGAALLVEGETD